MRSLPLLVLLAACHPHPRGPTTGTIAGYVRDSVSGAPIAAQLAAHGNDSLHVHSTLSGKDGRYTIEDLPPGQYGMLVVVPGITLKLTDIPVSAGHVTGVDVPVDPGDVDPRPMSFAKAEGGEIRTYQPADLDPSIARIEGTVTDSVTRERQPGAVVVATSPSATEVLTEVVDDTGHYRFDNVTPGTYSLSAFYQVPGRGQIEVQRNDVVVPGGSAVVVPIFIEVTGGH